MTIAAPDLPMDFVHNLLAGIDHAGGDRAAILSRAKLNTLEHATQVPQFVRLVRSVMLALDDEMLGLTERRQKVGTFALMAAYASHAPDVTEAINRLAQFFDLLDNALAIRTVQRRGRVELVFQRKPGRVVRNPLLIETTLLTAHRFAAWLGGSWVPISEVHFDHSVPNYPSVYKALFPRAHIRFDQSDNRLIMPLSATNRPVLRTEAQAVGWAKRLPLEAFLPVHAGDDLAQRVTKRIEDYLEQDTKLPSLLRVATDLGLPDHTLRRRLKTEGTSYLSLRNQARRDVAVRLLGTTEDSVERIAEATDFSEASAFIRAFRSWTGHTPRAFRASMLE